MVVRNDGDQLRRYCHIGTGNYNPKTARLYEDFGLLTSNPQVGEDVSNLFNVLSGYSLNTDYNRLLVAPHSVRTGLIARIDREITHQLEGRPSGIRIKCNSLVDEAIIDALYRASMAGVQVDIWVRGICSMRPGVPGLSDTVRIISVMGRFLEHSRVFDFANGGNPSVWIGSADLMHRNLDRRVEALVSISDPEQIAEIENLLSLGFALGTATWDLEADGSWTRRLFNKAGERLTDIQDLLIAIKSKRSSALGSGILTGADS
jgi:polyphosphate kinase